MYRVVEDTRLSEFIKQVNELLDEDYKLYGNLCVTRLFNDDVGEDVLYSQAMFKKRDDLMDGVW